jgi:hypothetical protein
MNPSTLFASPSTPHRPVIYSPFLSPLPLRSTTHSKKLTLQRRRSRASINFSADDQSAPSTSPPPPNNVFGDKRELTGIQPLVAKLSPPARLATSALILGAAIAAGYGLGSRFGKSQTAALGGAVVLGAAGGAAGYALNACAPDVAAADLHNYVAGHGDPRAVKKEDIEKIAKKSV